MTGLLDRPDASDPDANGAGDGLRGRPVVTLGGHDVAAIADPVTEGDEVVAYTLEKRTLFGGTLDAILPVDRILAVGPDAVVVVDQTAFEREQDDERLTPDLRIGDDQVEESGPAVSPTLFSEARRTEVAADDGGEQVGRVDRFVIDPATRSVSSLRLDHVASDVRFLSWRQITSFGQDRVTIADAGVLRKPDGPREDGCRRDFRATGKPVVTDEGHQLGEVADVEFDREDGRVTALVLDEGERIVGDRLRGLGPYAVVVRA